MEVGIAAGQFEGLRPVAVLVDVGEERTRVLTVVAATAEHHPATVARPRVVALGVGGVEFVQRPRRAGLQVENPEVAVVVPNVEHAVFAHGESEPAAVGRHSGQRGTQVLRGSIEHQFALSESHRLGVERLAVDVVFHLPMPTDDFLVVARCVSIFEVGAAIVEPLAVGSPAGEHLHLVGIVLQIHHLISLNVVDNQVALGVEHLNLVRVLHLKHLAGLVGGIDDELQPRMPGGIDASREDGVVLHAHLPHLAVVGNHRTAEVLTGVELHARGVVLLVVVAVDALSFAGALLAAEDVVVDDALVVVLQMALADGQFLVAHVGGRDESIAQVRVDAVVGDVDVEGLVLRPLASVAGIDLHADALGSGLRHKALPVVVTGLNLVAPEQQFLAAGREPRHHLLGLAGHLERQRRHVHRHRHLPVVGIDVGLFV